MFNVEKQQNLNLQLLLDRINNFLHHNLNDLMLLKYYQFDYQFNVLLQYSMTCP